MRATSLDRDAAAMMGIDVDRVIVFTFVLGSALAGAGGVLFAMRVRRLPSMGFIVGLEGFTAAVIGGIGSVPGAMLGGLLLGLIESVTQGYITTQWSESRHLLGPDRLHARPPPGPAREGRRSGRCEMSGYDDELTQPLEGAAEAAAAEGPTSPAVGRDEWVARHGERRARQGRAARHARGAAAARALVGLADAIRRALRLVPVVVTTAGTGGGSPSTPSLYMMLALGLNVVVGWGGLLDLGYVTFYGFGAYTYAILRSDQFDLHWPTLLVDRARRRRSAPCSGFLVGLPSRRLTRRLPGDRDALLLQIFLRS